MVLLIYFIIQKILGIIKIKKTVYITNANKNETQLNHQKYPIINFIKLN